MSTLRITQYAKSKNHFIVELRLEGTEVIQPPISVEFDFEMAEQDYSHIRWYLEDFLQYPMEPAPRIAQEVEKRMREIGIGLYEKIFGSRDALKLWGRLQTTGLGNIRMEIITGVRDAVAIPWELIWDPDTDTPLALEAESFVRAPSNSARLPKMLSEVPSKVRILLVISRPGGKLDVPFRSVAGKLIKGLDKEAWERFELDVLRPPTFEQLGKTLRRAKADGRPYHIVHFDGHGAYLSSRDRQAAGGSLRGQMPLLLSGTVEGANGYLLFENPTDEQNMELVDGTSLGRVLAETGVPVLVLNACRSAHADIQRTPDEGKDYHEMVRAYGSLAQEVMDAGVTGVVAMRYNIYVVTAAQFVAELYSSLASGVALGEAVSRGRKVLAENPKRTVAFDPVSLQDWCVPVVYEAAPLVLFPRSDEIRFNVEKSGKSWAQKSEMELPPEPDAGFFGRDEALLALDRAFDHDSIVLLSAYAGEGKTATVAEFARWYSATGGVSGPILFSKFDQYKPLSQLLDAIAEVFEPLLKQQNILWIGLDDFQRENLILQILRQIPVLWIWDNVETVAGFPDTNNSPWSSPL